MWDALRGNPRGVSSVRVSERCLVVPHVRHGS